MKATFSLVFALILSSQVLFAQSNVSIGLIGGPTVANFKGGFNDFLPKKWMPAFSIGYALRVDLKKHVFFQTDISYEGKGFSYGEIGITDFNAVVIETKKLYERFNYCVLTPSIGFRTSEKIYFEGSLGVFMAYLTDIKSMSTALTNPITQPSRTWEVTDFNRFDFGATARLGCGYDFGKKWSAKASAIGSLGFAQPFKPIIGASPEYGKDQTVSVGLQFGIFYKI